MKRLFPFALALMACMTFFSGCNSADISSQVESSMDLADVAIGLKVSMRG